MIPDWNVHALYVVGDLVELDGIRYRCLKNHESTDDLRPGVAVEYWEIKEGTP